MTTDYAPLLEPTFTELNTDLDFQLDYGMRYVWEKIAVTLSANRSTLLTGVVGFRTDETKHTLDPEGYENICLMKPLESMTVAHLKDLQRHIRPSHTDSGDAVSAIVLAVDMIQKATTLKTGKPGKYKRKILLLTDGQGPIDGEGLDEIASQIKELEIQLVVM
jgi:ATP-dependent DNA helicase 2 subunit 2